MFVALPHELLVIFVSATECDWLGFREQTGNRGKRGIMNAFPLVIHAYPKICNARGNIPAI